MFRRVLLAVVAAQFAAGPAGAAPSHGEDISTYVSIVAMAQVASERCDEMLANVGALRDAPSVFHITTEDAPLVAALLDFEIRRLEAAADGAPTVADWCETAYSDYGPEGSVVRNLLSR